MWRWGKLLRVHEVERRGDEAGIGAAGETRRSDDITDGISLMIASGLYPKLFNHVLLLQVSPLTRYVA